MANLFDALVGNLGDESHYYSQDPFYMGGAGFAKMQLPQAQTNSQAILGPALQGLLAGSLLGYGQRHAKETAFDEARQNPLLKELYGQYRPKGTEDLIGPLTQEQELSKALAGNVDAPAAWTIGQGKQDALLSAYKMQEALDLENQIKLKEAIAPFAYGNRQFSPEVQKALAAKLGTPEVTNLTPQEADALYKAGSLGLRQEQGERLSNPANQLLKIMGQKGRDDIAGSFGLMEQIDTAKQSLARFKNDSTIEYQLGSLTSASDRGKLKSEITLLANVITAAIQGAKPSDYDVQTYEKLLKGDMFVNVKDINQLVSQAQTILAKKALGQYRGYEALQSGTADEALARYAAGQGGTAQTTPDGGIPGVGQMYNGEKVIKTVKIR